MSEDVREPDALPGIKPPEQQARLIGHGPVMAALREQIASRRLPSAVLLHGPQGIGKATLAFALARQIFAATGDETPARISEQVAAGVFPNLYVLRRQPKDAKGFYTVIRVDDVRALRERMQQTRGRAGYRVAVIDSIDDCNPSAANALLKTLEEPPPETLFVLVSHRPGALLPTIRSRCHTLALRPLADGDVQAVLTGNVSAPATELDRAVSLARGRPRRGLEVLLLDDAAALGALTDWLSRPLQLPAGAHLELADQLGGKADGPEFALAKELLLSWLADEARDAALTGPNARQRLASATELWEKAGALFAEAEALNLDMRQTLVTLFDAIRRHLATTTAPAAIE